MRLLFVADGRSTTTASWLRYWIETDHETHLVSTYPCEKLPGLASFHVQPVAFGGTGREAAGVGSLNPNRSLFGPLRKFLLPLRYLIGPLSLPVYQARFRRLVESIQPEIVHALRIPFEGMLAAATPDGIPLLVSIWGNDLTLHAPGSFLMRQFTRRTLLRCQGLLADTSRDIQLAHQWDFSTDKPSLVVPGAGGIHLDEINSISISESLPEELPGGPIVVNSRGQRPGSIRQDVFIRSIPIVLKKIPQAQFVCPLLKGDPECEQLVGNLGIRSNVKLWPKLSQRQLWSLYKRSTLYVSPSLHDGTPNSLLEAMACGCFPVVGNIESMKEWISSGINGVLVDATSPESLAEAIVSALNDPILTGEAKNKNAQIVATRAEYRQCMAKSEAFYKGMLKL